jgi:DNA-binding MarR family transcriptional regulator
MAGEDSDRELARLLQQLTVETDRFAEVFGEAHGLHRTDLNALVVIMESNRRGEAISPTLLARALHLSASATTAVLDRLEASGHVHRDRDPSDRRRVGLVVAEQARRVGEQFFGPLAREMAHVWTPFTAEERATIARFLAVSIDATVRVRGGLVDPPGGQASTRPTPP